jgi:hypothetical protein
MDFNSLLQAAGSPQGGAPVQGPAQPAQGPLTGDEAIQLLMQIKQLLAVIPDQEEIAEPAPATPAGPALQ